MSRLTTTEYGAFCSHINTPDCDNCEDCKWWLAIVEKLARYEDLEEQGRLIVRKHERCEYCSDGETLKGQRIMASNYGWQDINYCPNCGAKMGEVEE